MKMKNGGKRPPLWKRYRFFGLFLLLDLVLLFAAPDLGQAAVAASWKSLLQMLSIIPPIFLLMGLLDVWVPRETMMRYMGPEAGLKGGVFAFALGSFSAGPLYAAFPVAAMFLRKGVSLTNVFLFLGAWSTTKIPMMLFEVTQLGARFAVTRFALNLAGILVLAVVMEKTTSPKDAEEMLRAAAAQPEGGPKT